MRVSAATFCLAAAVLANPSPAQQSKPPTEAEAVQQHRMTACNPEASKRDLDGDAGQTSCPGGKMNQTSLMKV
jgi:hypothetical protein